MFRFNLSVVLFSLVALIAAPAYAGSINVPHSTFSNSVNDAEAKDSGVNEALTIGTFQVLIPASPDDEDSRATYVAEVRKNAEYRWQYEGAEALITDTDYSEFFKGFGYGTGARRTIHIGEWTGTCVITNYGVIYQIVSKVGQVHIQGVAKDTKSLRRTLTAIKVAVKDEPAAKEVKADELDDSKTPAKK